MRQNDPFGSIPVASIVCTWIAAETGRFDAGILVGIVACMTGDVVVPVAGHLVDDAKIVARFLHFKKENALARVVVGAVAAHHQLAAEGAEQHGVRAVHGVERILALHPRAGDFAGQAGKEHIVRIVKRNHCGVVKVL